MMNKQILFQGKKISYSVIGQGNPVMLVHGFGEDSTVWRMQIKLPQTPPHEGLPTPLSEQSLLGLPDGKFKFIIPDLPGTGESQLIDDMSMEGMAEVMKEIIDIEAAFPNPSEGKAPPAEEFGETFTAGDRAAIIGHSMGGYITLAFAEKYPDLLSGFGLFHSSAFADNEEKKATRRKGIDFINQHGAYEFLKTATPNLFSPSSKVEKPGLLEEQVAAAHNFSAEALVSYYEAMMKRPERTAILEKSTVPVLFIMGKYDTAVPMEDGLKQCHLAGKSYIHVLQNSGHMGMLEEPDESNRVLKEFLQEI